MNHRTYLKCVAQAGFEPAKPEASDLQSDGFDRFHYRAEWWVGKDSNLRARATSGLQPGALPLDHQPVCIVIVVVVLH